MGPVMGVEMIHTKEQRILESSKYPKEKHMFNFDADCFISWRRSNLFGAEVV